MVVSSEHTPTKPNTRSTPSTGGSFQELTYEYELVRGNAPIQEDTYFLCVIRSDNSKAVDSSRCDTDICNNMPYAKKTRGVAPYRVGCPPFNQ